MDDKNDSLLILSGILDFTVDEGQLIVTIAADFADPNVHTDTFFKFVKQPNRQAQPSVVFPRL